MNNKELPDHIVAGQKDDGYTHDGAMEWWEPNQEGYLDEEMIDEGWAIRHYIAQDKLSKLREFLETVATYNDPGGRKGMQVATHLWSRRESDMALDCLRILDE